MIYETRKVTNKHTTQRAIHFCICFSPEQESFRLEECSLELLKSLEQGVFESLGLFLDKAGGSLLSAAELSSRESMSPSEEHRGQRLFARAAHRH